MSRNIHAGSKTHNSVHIHMRKTRGHGEGSGMETGSLPGGALLQSEKPKPGCLSLCRVPSLSHSSHATLRYFGFCYTPHRHHLSTPEMPDECVRKCFLLPSSDGEFIRGILPPPLCRHALPCGRFLPSPEAQGTCLMWSCARDLKPCCCLLGRLLFLATDLR